MRARESALGLTFWVAGAGCSTLVEFDETAVTLEPETSTVRCADGIDNDGDDLRDCEDPECGRFCPERELGQCSDGLDNDGNGFSDLTEVSCWSRFEVSTLRADAPIEEPPSRVIAAALHPSGDTICAIVALEPGVTVEPSHVFSRDASFAPAQGPPTGSSSLEVWRLEVLSATARLAARWPLTGAGVAMTDGGMIWATDRARWEAIAGGYELDSGGRLRKRYHNAAASSCDDLELTPLELVRPYGEGEVVAMEYDIDSGRRDLFVALGDQHGTWIRPRSGGGAFVVRPDIRYWAAAPASSPTGFLRGVSVGRDTELFPSHVGSDFEQIAIPPNRVSQFLGGFGASAYVVDEAAGIKLLWADRSASSGGLSGGPALARPVVQLLGPSTDPSSFDAAAVRDGRLLFDRRASESGAQLVFRLLYRGFERVETSDSEQRLHGGQLGLARVTVARPAR